MAKVMVVKVKVMVMVGTHALTSAGHFIDAANKVSSKGGGALAKTPTSRWSAAWTTTSGTAAAYGSGPRVCNNSSGWQTIAMLLVMDDMYYSHMGGTASHTAKSYNGTARHAARP